MSLTQEQILQMAPDPASAAAGRKLANTRDWTDLGKSTQAIWGKCKGSAVYQVKIDQANMGYACSCPSRKFPCKHVIGLLLLSIQSGPVADATEPEWIVEWLSKRREKEEKKAEKQAQTAAAPVDEKAQQKRAEQRSNRVQDGLERLDLWMKDLVRAGLAGIEQKSAAFWEDQAKRLVDSQAPSLAGRVRRLAEIPGSGKDWAERLLGELGKVKLLMHAFSRLDQLQPHLQQDIRQAIGWNVSQEEIEKFQDQVTDEWLTLGQWIDDEERVRVQRTWLLGQQTGRYALMLSFSVGGQPFSERFYTGLVQKATLAFYPSACAQRAKIMQREETPALPTLQPPGFATMEYFLADVTQRLAEQPWQNTFGALLLQVTIEWYHNQWYARDNEGFALPLTGNCWEMLAKTGGESIDLGGEWNGRHFRPLGFFGSEGYTIV